MKITEDSREFKEMQEDAWFEGLSSIFKYVEIEATPQQQKKLFFYILATLSKFFRDNADCKLSIGYFDFIKRSLSEKILFNVEINDLKAMPTAEYIEYYYVQGGMECDILKDMIAEFTDSISSYIRTHDEVDIKRIAKLDGLLNKKKDGLDK